MCGIAFNFEAFMALRSIIARIRNWEAWPFGVLYAPLAPFWLYYTIRSGSVWFFTPSNPKITFGGMDGEPKKEMYDLLPAALYPATVHFKVGVSPEAVAGAIREKGISFPLVVKPEVGCQGLLFRKLDHAEQLAQYVCNVPVDFMVQAFAPYAMEVSVFYIRLPWEQKGKITGFLQKIPLQVVGDGLSTLKTLIEQHPKASKRVEELYAKHHENWDQIIGKDEVYKLSYAANHNRGAFFVDLREHIDDRLCAHFDQISHSIDDFFYGRYDILCQSIEDLKAWKQTTILEYNGCGAEPNHFYDTGYTLGSAYSEILFHWKMLFTICRYNTKRGIKPWGLGKGIRFVQEIRAHYKQLRQADAAMP